MNKWGLNINGTTVRDVYPNAPGATTASLAAAQTVDSNQGSDMPSAEAGAVRPALNAMAGRGIMGQPLTWWAIIAAMLFALMYAAKRTGQASEFGNIKLSAYNILTITMAAMIGMALFKVLFTRVRVPGLSDFVMAA